MNDPHAAIAPDERRGDWIQTYGGRPFWPLDPRPEDVDIRDIAHALSLTCRYGGHALRFYSVAEHSVLLSRAVPPALAPWALLHDAAEAYLTDVPRPVKPALAGFAAVEARILTAIAVALGLNPLTVPPEVKLADTRIVEDERLQVMAPPARPWAPNVGLGVMVRFWSPREAEAAFLDRHDELMRGAP